MKLLKKNAEDRYQSAYGLRRDLLRCRESLQANGEIASFPPGLNDYSDKFQIPRKLYGRDRELQSLRDALERVRSGGCELLMITGPGGAGKSALVHEIQKSIIEKNGYFVEGKFDGEATSSGKG